MKVNVSIAGIATSSARMRALALVREALAKREAGVAEDRRKTAANRADFDDQQTRGK